ncbi:MAG: glycosyltransferase family 4 protein [Pseudomonadota bacterium]
MRDIRAVAPNLKRRLSGVTATIARLVPLMDGVVATGPGLPEGTPHIPVWRAMLMPRDRWRVWHARRNTEMLLGLFLRHILRRRYKLIFTSASQRSRTGYTKWLMGNMDAIVATCQKTASVVHLPSRVILHGVNTRVFYPAPDRTEAKRKLGLPEGDIYVGCFGRVRPQKGTDVFVDAMIAACKADRRLRGVIIGRATEKHVEYQKRLDAKIRNAGLHHRIRFVPEVPMDAVADWYRAMDLFIAPNRLGEGFGLTVLEAMACAVPVIATRVGAFEELVVPGETGALVDQDDTDAIIASIDEIVGGKLEAYQEAAVAHVRKNFPLEREASELLALYEELLGNA